MLTSRQPHMSSQGLTQGLFYITCVVLWLICVVSWPGIGDFTENLQIVCQCHMINNFSFEPFMCLELSYQLKTQIIKSQVCLIQRYDVKSNHLSINNGTCGYFVGTLHGNLHTLLVTTRKVFILFCEPSCKGALNKLQLSHAVPGHVRY